MAYRIWCIIINDMKRFTAQSFDVFANSDVNIFDLQGMVKDRVKPDLSEVAITWVQLWKVDKRVSNTTSVAAFKKEIAKLRFPDRHLEEESTDDVQLLNPARKLSHYWETAPEEGCLHVIARVLPGARISTSISSDSHHSVRAEELRVVYDNAWGKRWPTRKETISSDSISITLSDDTTDVDMILANDICYYPDDNGGPTQQASLPWEYTCLDNIQLLDRALQIPIKVPDVIVVRDEYITLREALEAGKGSFVLTGQSGIGKSMFLIYLLLYRLEKKLPTAVQFSSHYVLFDERGVKVHRKDHPLTLSDSCWALTDSNSVVKEPCLGFKVSHARIIQAAPPEVERWESWSKHAKGPGYCGVMIVDLPKPHEVAAIAQELHYDPSTAITLLNRWGPCIRTIVNILENPSVDDEHRKEVVGAGGRLADRNLVFHTDYIQELDSTSSSMLFIYPIRNPKPCSKIGRYVPTVELLKIYDRICEQVPHQGALNLIQILSMHPSTRTLPVWQHEERMHFAMAYSSHSLELVRRDRSMTMYKKLRPRELLPSTTDALKRGLNTDNREFYWFPLDEKFKGIDGVLADRGDIFVLQATIAENDCSPVDGLRKLSNLLDPNPKQPRRWKFVTVVDDEYLITQYTTSFEKDLAGFCLGKGQIEVWGTVLPKTI